MVEQLIDAANTPDHLAPVESAAADALEQATDLPFFDLDIALIRRGQRIAQPQTPQPSRQPVMRAKVAPALPSREQQALAALAALAGGKATPSPVARLQPANGAMSVAPVITPVIVPVAAPIADRYLTPEIMPTGLGAGPSVSFVHPAFERIAEAASVSQPAAQPDTTGLILAGIRDAAGEIVAQAADRAREINLAMQFGRLATQLGVREQLLLDSRPAPAARQAPAPIVGDTPAADISDDLPHELPWGHVTYRLLVM